MRNLIIIGICFSSLIYSVAGFSNNQKTILLNPQAHSSNQRVCLFEDKRYSEGAIIIMSDVRVQCAAKNPNINNSELSWLILNEKNEVVYPKPRKKIHIN